MNASICSASSSVSEGKPTMARGADDHAGDLGAQLGNSRVELLLRPAAVHGLENARVAVLHGDIDIGQDLGRIADRLDEFVSHALGLQIEHADPHVGGRTASLTATRAGPGWRGPRPPG